MASARQILLAQLIAEGVDGVEACLQAGWPYTTARWLGLQTHEYLAEAGVQIPSPAGDSDSGDAAVVVVSTNESDLSVTELPAETVEEMVSEAEVESEPSPRRRGRPRQKDVK